MLAGLALRHMLAMLTTSSGRRLVLATAALLVVLSALHWTTPTPRMQALSDTLQIALCLVGSVLCFRAAALARSLARVFWTVFGLGSLLWAGGVPLLPSYPAEWVDRVGPWNSFFAASSIAYVLACAPRPDRPRGGLGVAFDVAILAVLALHTWFYFAAAYPRSRARVPADWAAMLRDGRFALMLACAAWLVEGSRAPWRRIYLGLAAAIVLLSGGSSALHRAAASGLYHPGLWDLPKTLPFLWIGLLALDRPAHAAEETGAFGPGWADLRRGTIKFTPDRGEITVRLALEPGWHRISVEDTGIGIEAEELDSIWERFYAGANPLQHTSGTYEFKARGSGLGLAIAEGYVEAHGGRIWATSGGGGRGAAFNILLPSAAGASPGAIEP